MSNPPVNIDSKTAAVFERKNYSLVRALSSGSFGQVFMAKRTDGSDEIVAVKVMDLDKANDNLKNKFYPREMKAMIDANHRYIIRLYDIFRSNHKLYIFMEFAGNGDLSGYIKKHKAIPEQLACRWFTQASEALSYLHNGLFIAHRDIKLDNVLLNSENEAKLSDFGFARKAWDEEKKEVILSDTFCGTEPYFSPQLVMKIKYDVYKADVWAMGIMLFAMINDKFVYHFREGSQKMLTEMKDSEHLNKRYVKQFCKHIKQLIKGMLTIKESERYEVNDILKNSWIVKKSKCCS